MIIVEKNSYKTDDGRTAPKIIHGCGSKYTWIAHYGDRLVLGTTADDALQRAWSMWGGDVPALVHT